eukprot:7353002-Prymnesium_polylepis.1
MVLPAAQTATSIRAPPPQARSGRARPRVRQRSLGEPEELADRVHLGEVEHVAHKRQRRVRRGEGRHALAVVVRNLAGERRHGTLDRRGGHEAHDAEHGEAAVVDLAQQAALLRLRALRL